MSMAYLPEEILINIFSQLPAKSIGNCKCVAKPWRNLLSTPHFIKSHLTMKTHRENVILINRSGAVHSIADFKDHAISKKLDLPLTWKIVAGSSNGLVLLTNRHNMLLLNPITLQQLRIVNWDVALMIGGHSVHGFGYDSVSDDYKVVTLICDDIDTSVYVYSVKRGVWRRVEGSPYDHSCFQFSSGALVNETVHWLCCPTESDSGPWKIAAFSLADEVFEEIPTTTGMNLEGYAGGVLGVLGGCLCVIDDGFSELWVMKEYGVIESWTKFSIEAYPYRDMVKLLCYLGDDEVVFVRIFGDISFVYNVKDGSLRDMTVDGVPANFTDGCTFVDSLVSPNGIIDFAL